MDEQLNYLGRPASVCVVTPEFLPTVGGVAKSVSRLVTYLDAAGVRVCIVTTDAGVAAGATASSVFQGIPVWRLGKQADELLNLKECERLVRVLDGESRFDVFHGFFLPFALPCLRVAKGRPVVASIRGSDAVNWTKDSTRRAIVAEVMRDSTLVTTVAHDLAAVLENLHRPVRQVRRIPNAIDESGAGRKWRATQSNRGVVGTVGNFRAKKNLPLMVRAYSRMPSGIRKALVLCGDFRSDPMAERDVRDAIDARGLTAEVRFLGALQPGRPVFDALREMRAFTICSDHDGFPNALLEAAAVGVPLVVTAVGGMRDYMRDELDGLLVPPGDEAGLGKQMLRVLQDEDLANALSAGAIGFAKRFDIAAERVEWLTAYRTLLRLGEDGGGRTKRSTQRG